MTSGKGGGLSRPTRSSYLGFTGTPQFGSSGSMYSNQSDIRDDISDVSLSEMSLSISYSVNPIGYHRGSILNGNNGSIVDEKNGCELFADHAVKIYRRENERHWRRIRERLSKVGITKLLTHISLDDDHKTNGANGANGGSKKVQKCILWIL